MMAYQSKFIAGNRGAILVRDVDNGGVYTYAGAEGK